MEECRINMSSTFKNSSPIDHPDRNYTYLTVYCLASHFKLPTYLSFT